jgi:hypothetical protein
MVKALEQTWIKWLQTATLEKNTCNKALSLFTKLFKQKD